MVWRIHQGIRRGTPSFPFAYWMSWTTEPYFFLFWYWSYLSTTKKCKRFHKFFTWLF
jgi:hypothetical protein